MKKILSFVAIAAMFAIYSCGPSAEERAKAEQARQDSITAVESANKAAEEAAAMQAMEAAKQDSIAKATAMADSIANAGKGKKK